MNKLAVTLLCLAAAAGVARADDAWLTFDDPGGGFRVEVTSPPSVGHITSKTADGTDVITTTYDVQREGYELTFSDTDLSRVQADGGRALDGGVAGIKGLLVTVRSDAICNLDGQVGREVVGVDKDGNTFDERIFFVAGHLYQALTVEPKNIDQASLDATKHFRDTFSLTVR